MRVLGFDVTSPRLTVGLAEDGRSVGRWDEHARRDRGNTLELTIHRALEETGRKRGEIDGLALVTGPGSLTALRIGWATAAGWALAGGIPVTGWPVPAVQKRWWFSDGAVSQSSTDNRPVYCVVHHRGDEFYAYNLDDWNPGDEPEAIVLGEWDVPSIMSVRLVGPGVTGYRDRWMAVAAARSEVVTEADSIIGGGLLAVWGCDSLTRGETLDLSHSPLDYGLPPVFRKVP